MLPIFDGHNDALTREDHADLAGGRSGGHLDLPRMRQGGMRGGIFAVFTPSSGDDSHRRQFGDGGSYSEPLAAPVPHASAAAGRLLALERAGARRGDRSRPRVAAALARRRPALAGTGLEPGQRVRPRRSLRLPLLP